MNKVLPLLFIIALLAACKTKKESASPSELSPLKAKRLMAEMMSHQKDYNSFSARASVQYQNGDNSQSFNANLQYQKDSAFLAKITATLGIEAARMMISRDAVRIINRLKKQYTEKSFQNYGDVLPFPVRLELVQNVLLGNAFVDEKGDISSSVEGQFHVLTVNGKKVKTTIWLNPDNFTKERMLVEDLTSGRRMTVRYSDYREKKNELFPYKQQIQFQGEKQMQLDMTFTQLELNDDVSFPFSIPDQYKKENK
ncbi:MAG: hypothetical protein BRD50_04220 [Bacteroidetes bacterium SW_11_45_7]|nr:MAG: hypothetical protein BRD50_04220 [Bacteroidetes bacterium SW_11_45_7]